MLKAIRSERACAEKSEFSFDADKLLAHLPSIFSLAYSLHLAKSFLAFPSESKFSLLLFLSSFTYNKQITDYIYTFSSFKYLLSIENKITNLPPPA